LGLEKYYYNLLFQFFIIILYKWRKLKKEFQDAIELRKHEEGKESLILVALTLAQMQGR
jgi:hypothetical protein